MLQRAWWGSIAIFSVEEGLDSEALGSIVHV